MNKPLAKAATEARARRVAYRTRGRSHGPITRLVSPSDLGELIKPFVFLDCFDIDPKRMPAIGFHPHSGIATLTLLLEGQISYEETSGTKGIIEPGGVEWMRAAGGVWHTGGAVGSARAKGYQLWVALPPEMEGIESEAQYLGGEHFQSHGPARVILGRLGDATSKVSAPAPMNYFDVALKKGEQWRYEPPVRRSWLHDAPSLDVLERDMIKPNCCASSMTRVMCNVRFPRVPRGPPQRVLEQGEIRFPPGAGKVVVPP